MQRSKSRINPWLLIFSGVLMLLMVISLVAVDNALAQGPRGGHSTGKIGSGGSGQTGGAAQPTSPPPGDAPTETPVPTLEPTVVPTPSGTPSRPGLPEGGGALSVEPFWLFLSMLAAASIAAGIAIQRRTR